MVLRRFIRSPSSGVFRPFCRAEYLDRRHRSRPDVKTLRKARKGWQRAAPLHLANAPRPPGPLFWAFSPCFRLRHFWKAFCIPNRSPNCMFHERSSSGIALGPDSGTPLSSHSGEDQRKMMTQRRAFASLEASSPGYRERSTLLPSFKKAIGLISPAPWRHGSCRRCGMAHRCVLVDDLPAFDPAQATVRRCHHSR